MVTTLVVLSAHSHLVPAGHLHGVLVLTIDVLMVLLLLGSEHVHTGGAHVDGAEVAHVLGLFRHILGNTEHDAVGDHLILPLVPLVHYHLLRGHLLGLPELVVLVDDFVGGGAEDLNGLNADDANTPTIVLVARRDANVDHRAWLL